MKVLLVSEQPEGELARAMGREGHEVLTLGEEECSEGVIKEGEPGCVLVVGRDAPKICRALRRASPDVVIIAIVASRHVEDRIAALDAGADDCLARPFQGLELEVRMHATCRRAVRRARALRTLVSYPAGPPE